MIASPPPENIRQERDLMVVLPVLQGRNISGDKLQYVYTKAPVTMVISDPQPTTHRPVSTKSWPASFASKAQVFLVEPNDRRPLPHHSFSPEWVGHTISTTQRPNYSEGLHRPKVAAKSTNPPMVQLSSDNRYNISTSTSKVTWKKSTDKTLVKWTAAEDVTSTPSTIAEPALNITTAHFLQFNSSAANTSVPDDKTVTQLALDLQASTNKLTNDIKSMLLHLGLLAQGSEPQGESNELEAEGSENTNLSTDSSSYMKFKNIPVQNELTIQDDMRQLLNTFGLLPSKNTTSSTDETASRVKRNTKEQGPDSLLDQYQLFSQTVDKSSKGMKGHPSKRAPLKSEINNGSIKPLAGFRQQKRQVMESKRTRAVDTGASANELQSKGDEPNNKGTATVEQLSGSFGGELAAEQNTAPKPTNGLYFWVDWNTFLNLTGKPDVRLAYSSKAGDSTKFVPITDWRNKL